MIGMHGAIVALVAVAGGPPNWSIEWSTIDGGGGFSVGAEWTLEGTIGQPDAGILAGAEWELLGGFWPGPLVVTACLGDLDRDGSVGGGDLAIVLGAWGGVGPGLPGDLTGDGTVDASDLATVLGAWGPCP